MILCLLNKAALNKSYFLSPKFLQIERESAKKLQHNVKKQRHIFL